jgi:hypothetical protein
MEHGSNLIERIKSDLKAFEFGLICFYPLYPLFCVPLPLIFFWVLKIPNSRLRRFIRVTTFLTGNKFIFFHGGPIHGHSCGNNNLKGVKN